MARRILILVLVAAIASSSFPANAAKKDKTELIPWGTEVLSKPCHSLTLADNQFWFIRYPAEKAERGGRWLERFDPVSGEVTVVAELIKEQRPRPVAIFGDSVWIVLKEGLFKLDATGRNQQIRPEMEIEGIPYDDYNEWGITVQGLYGELIVGERYIWLKSRAASGKKEKLHRIELTATVAVGIPKSQGKWVNSWGPIVAANGALWIGSWDRVYRVDPESHQALDEILLPRKTPKSLLEAFGWIWMDFPRPRDGLARIDPATYEVQEIEWDEDLEAKLKWFESHSIPNVERWLLQGSDGLWFVFAWQAKPRAFKFSDLWEWWGVEIAPDTARVRRIIELGTSAEWDPLQPVIRDNALWKCNDNGLYRSLLEPAAGQENSESTMAEP